MSILQFALVMILTPCAQGTKKDKIVFSLGQKCKFIKG